jgi:hypothetical protein
MIVALGPRSGCPLLLSGAINSAGTLTSPLSGNGGTLLTDTRDLSIARTTMRDLRIARMTMRDLRIARMTMRDMRHAGRSAR